jgi:ribosome biogenesis protein ENP2
MEEKRASRIAPKQTNEHKVNADFAERLERKADDKTKDAKVAKSILSDNRFGSLFQNPDFEIDEDDRLVEVISVNVLFCFSWSTVKSL